MERENHENKTNNFECFDSFGNAPDLDRVQWRHNSRDFFGNVEQFDERIDSFFGNVRHHLAVFTRTAKLVL